MPVVAVLDANVLYPAPVRDILLHVAFLSAYQPKWSDEIQEEWTRNLLAKRSSIKKSSLHNTRKWMESVFPDARTPIDNTLKISIKLPDTNDIHVVETAISSEANYIITFNLRDFPNEELGKHSIEAIHPDEFLSQLIVDLPDLVLRAFNNQVSMLKNPEKTTDEVLEALNRCGLPKTVQNLRRLIQNSTVI